MEKNALKGHFSIAAAYTIFGLNLVFCKDIANSETISPYVLFTLRAIGASLLFWALSIFTPREKNEKGDYLKIAAAVFCGRTAFLLSTLTSNRVLGAFQLSMRQCFVAERPFSCPR